MGGSDDVGNAAATSQSVPWGVYILPYLEQNNLFQRFKVCSISGSKGGQMWNNVTPPTAGLTFTFNNPPNNTDSTDPTVNPAATPLAVYRCPSSPESGQKTYRDTWTAQDIPN